MSDTEDRSISINKLDESDSDYEPISDGEFELEKYDHEASGSSSFIDKCEHHDYQFQETSQNSLKTESHIDIVENDEVYNLLDEALKEKIKEPNLCDTNNISSNDFKEYEKIVLEEVCKNHFDILPENWIEATHKSGMPIYLHKKSRVVTLSRPYFLGPGNPTSHLAPLSAISCLQYKKAIQAQNNMNANSETPTSKIGDMIIPNAKVETAQENIVKESLSHQELREYCQSLFRFVFILKIYFK